jgi:hypothetical protein
MREVYDTTGWRVEGIPAVSAAVRGVTRTGSPRNPTDGPAFERFAIRL